MRINHQKGCMLAKLLYTTFRSEGIHGQSAIPEDLLPEGVARGSREHLLFITLTVAIDYQRDAVALWNSSRFTFEDPATRYLFEPAELDLMPFDMETIPIPVDIHVARATLTLGVVKGRYEGSVQYLFESIREAWFKSVEGIIRPDGLPMIALDVDEPLWHLSRNGCSKRDRSGACAKRQTCLCKDYCIPGNRYDKEPR